MSPRRCILPLLALLPLFSGCAYSAHLQYDHGRSFMQSYAAQSDLARPSAADAGYPLSGFEGLELRQRVLEDTTNAETTTPDAVEVIGVE